jgi:hypothetical protein
MRPIHLDRRKTFPSPGEFFCSQFYDGNMTHADGYDLSDYLANDWMGTADGS